MHDDFIDLRPAIHSRTYVFIEPDEFPELSEDIFIPEAHREQREHKHWWGTVFAVAPGHWVVDPEDGRVEKFQPSELRIGDRVFYERNAGAVGDPLRAYGLAVVPEEAILCYDEEVRERL